jgi:hypothetical protein
VAGGKRAGRRKHKRHRQLQLTPTRGYQGRTVPLSLPAG